MAEPLVFTMLRSKRAEIEDAIVAYEKRLIEARANLAHITATLRMFELTDDLASLPAYVDLGRLFKRGEVVSICFAALAEEGPLDTRELGLRVVRAKGLDETDGVLRQTVVYRVIQALAIQRKRGRVRNTGKRRAVLIWALPA
ncbi:hypothetical protein [Methylocapsa acidiphila]|uniref:hypothetical protein n=1 Tax=Methylocapsa acidiphila TaxID=133552 RepID=UPI0003FAE095|nr:hypothetical protein [Methylocapsa acidiphila]